MLDGIVIDGATAPAWFQAIGSILAVWAMWAVAAGDRKARRAEVAHQAITGRAMAAEIARLARDTVAEVGGALSDYDPSSWFWFSDSRLASATAALRAIPPAALADPASVRALAVIASQLDLLQASLRALRTTVADADQEELNAEVRPVVAEVVARRIEIIAPEVAKLEAAASNVRR
jgi:hypothetical protein